MTRCACPDEGPVTVDDVLAEIDRRIAEHRAQPGFLRIPRRVARVDELRQLRTWIEIVKERAK